MKQQTVTEGPAVKRKQRQPQKAPKSPEFVDTDSDIEDDSDNEKEEPHTQKTSPGSVNKEMTQPVKTPSVTSRPPVTSFNYILTSGLKKGKQCKLKASGKTGKFCHLHKRHNQKASDASLSRTF